MCDDIVQNLTIALATRLYRRRNLQKPCLKNLSGHCFLKKVPGVGWGCILEISSQFSWGLWSLSTHGINRLKVIQRILWKFFNWNIKNMWRVTIEIIIPKMCCLPHVYLLTFCVSWITGSNFWECYSRHCVNWQCSPWREQGLQVLSLPVLLWTMEAI